jgi:phosphatidate cytidylyltransferase
MNQFIVFSLLFLTLFIVNFGWYVALFNFRENRVISSPFGQKNKDFLLNMGRRFKVTWFLFFVLALAFCFGYIGLTIFFMFVSFLCLREFVSVIHLSRSDYWSLFVSFYIFLPIQYLFVLLDVPFLFYIFIPVYAFLLSPIITMLSGDRREFFERSSKFQWAQISCIYCLSYIPAIAGLELNNGTFESSSLLLYFIVVLFMSDVFQYISGNWIGGKKIAPRLSPNKTWNAMILGVVLSGFIGFILTPLTPFSPFASFLIALTISLFGSLGRLVMSGIKRSLLIKDWSDLLGIQGGALDRVASMLFAAPFFYHLCRYFYI